MSNQARSSSGGVRNLRAMFEQKDDSSTSPPDRGRSPAGSFGGGSNGTSPRPLSKVRTSFVTVERSGQFGGQLGLRKENDLDPSLANPRPSFSIDEETDPVAMADKKEAINTVAKARKMNTVTSETVPESAIAATPPIESAQKSSYMNGKSTKPNGSSEKKITQMETAAAATENLKPSSPTKTTSKASSAKTTTKPAPISTTRAPTASKSTSSTVKSPAVPKTPTTPAKTPTTPARAARTLPTKAPVSKSTVHKSPERKATKPVATASVPKVTARPANSSSAGTHATKKPAPVPSATGFVKPRPKSPTKPVKLPASLMAQTASSQSKLAGSTSPPRRQSLAPSSAVNPAHKPASRSPSRMSQAPKIELRRTKSSIHSDRPALGRPPTSTLRKQTSRQSLPKQVAPADEGFLARMMRPTTSSASKVLEKPLTPPRERAKSTTRPQTRDSMVSHKSHEGLKGSPSTKKLPLTPKLAKVEAPKLTSKEPEKTPASASSAENGVISSVTSTAAKIGEGSAHVDTIMEEEPTLERSAPAEVEAEPEAAGPAKVDTPIVAKDSNIQEEKKSSKPAPAEVLPLAESTSEVATEEPSTESKAIQTPKETGHAPVVEEAAPSVDTAVEEATPSELVPVATDSKVELGDSPKVAAPQEEPKDDEASIEDSIKTE